MPYSHSEELYERAAEPKRLLLLEGGDHRSAQHDAELQGESLRWLARALAKTRPRRPALDGHVRVGCSVSRTRVTMLRFGDTLPPA